MFEYPFAKIYPITQRFGENPQSYPLTNGHNGIDFGVSVGTEVLAICPGKILEIRWDAGGYGLHIRQQIENSSGIVIYAHLDQALVKKNQQVASRQKIALSGNTGRSTGPHLHLEYRPDGKKAIDFLQLLKMPDSSMPEAPKEALSKFVRVTSNNLRIRLQPEMNSTNIRGLLQMNDQLEVVDVNGEWVGVKVWVHYSFLENIS